MQKKIIQVNIRAKLYRDAENLLTFRPYQVFYRAGAFFVCKYGNNIVIMLKDDRTGMLDHIEQKHLQPVLSDKQKLARIAIKQDNVAAWTVIHRFSWVRLFRRVSWTQEDQVNSLSHIAECACNSLLKSIGS